MKLLIADKFSGTAIEELKSLGLEVSYDAELKDSALVEALRVQQPAILVVRSTKVTADMLGAADSLQLVVRAGAGVNTIDVNAASKLGIFVTNCPGKNAVAVAELTMGLILALDRRIPENVAALRGGEWNKGEFCKARGLKGRTLGLIGLGNIGKEVALRAQAFDMRVIGWSRSLTESSAEELGIGYRSTPAQVAEESQIVSVHLALTSGTRGICDKSFFNALKKDAFFINTSRDEVVDEGALLEAIKTKNIRVGTDVFAGEPTGATATWQSEFSTHPNVIGTHHIGASTDQAQEAIGDEALRIVKTFIKRGEVLNCVNIDLDTPATHILSVRHLNRVGVLAAVLSELQKADINVLDMENKIFEGDEAAIAKLRLSQEADKTVIEAIRRSHTAVISISILEAKRK